MAGEYAGAIPMSKTKYVGYIDGGFWAYDVALEVFLKHLIDAAEASDQAETPWLSTAISEWRAVASIPDIGLTLNEGWSPEQRLKFVSLADRACAKIGERTSIPAEEVVAWPLLDDLRIFPRGATEVLTAPVVELGRATIELISGTLPDPPTGSTAWLYGTDEGRTTLGLMPIRRRLRKNERDLIVAMLGGKSHEELTSSLDADTVEDMQDGGMGGIRFLSDDKRRGTVASIAEAEYTDDDGVIVSIVLNTDAKGALYEVDFWKTDFSPLRRYPSPSDLRLK
jgi:hypothetical protein